MYKFSQLKKFTVCLIGRSSVGKSSLFNKLQNGESQITSSDKNITRDRKEAISDLFPVPVRLIDTAGIENIALKQISNPLQQKMMLQTINAVQYSDLALFVVDAKLGLQPSDYQISKWVNKLIQTQSTTIKMSEQLKDLQISSTIKNAILVANKSENIYTIDPALKRLGMGEPIMVSAMDGTGFQDLLAKIMEYIPKNLVQELKDLKLQRKEKYQSLKEKYKKEVQDLIDAEKLDISIKQWEKEFDMANQNPSENSDLDDENVENPVYAGISIQQTPGVTSENIERRRPISISIVGRPNVGKSSLVNRLLGYDRMIADETPGTTRDPISTEWVFKGQKIQLVDTAGINAQHKNEIDIKAQARTKYILRYSHVVVVMIDALGSFRDIDLDIAQDVVADGRAIVLCVNKWDMVDNSYKPRIIKYLNRQLEKSLGEIKSCPLVFISAEKKTNTDELMTQILQANKKWNTRISTGLLNDWLNKFKKIESLPSEEGEKLKIRFISQVKVRPPTFAVFINEGSLFKNNYLRFLRNKLAQEFGLEGVPIRLILRDVKYSKQRKILEKANTSTVRDQLLKRRRIAKLARIKLEQLRKGKLKP